MSTQLMELVGEVIERQGQYDRNEIPFAPWSATFLVGLIGDLRARIVELEHETA